MSATLVYVGIGSVLATSVTILVVAVLLLRVVRRYVELAEERLELLREGQEMLVRISYRERRAAEGEREPVREAVRAVGAEAGRPARDPAPDRDRAKAAPAGEPPGDGRPQDSGDPGRYVQEALGLGGKEPAEGGSRLRRPAPGGGKPRLGVKVPHPDDDVTPRGEAGAPVELFQKFYDRHLEHYEGYVRLAGRLHRTREEAGASADATVPAAREWEDKLRRAHEAIERNTERLDMLEEYYPELATDDDRISRRAAVARLHADLVRRFGGEELREERRERAGGRGEDRDG